MKEDDQEQSAGEAIRGVQGREFTLWFSNPSLALIPTYKNIHKPQNILCLGRLERSSSSCNPSYQHRSTLFQIRKGKQCTYKG